MGMKKRKTCLVAVVLAGLLVPGVLGDGGSETREFTYVGGASMDHQLTEQCADRFGGCPVVVYKGTNLASCDDAKGVAGLGAVGVGGGVFCGVPAGAQVRVQVDDGVHPEPVASLSCPVIWGGGDLLDGLPVQIWSWYHFGVADPVFEGTVPEACLWDDATQIEVYLQSGSATTGTVSLRVG